MADVFSAEFADLRRRLDSLTKRERDVQRLAAWGFGLKETARVLGIGHGTVEHHRENLLKKLGVQGITHATTLVTLVQTADENRADRLIVLQQTGVALDALE